MSIAFSNNASIVISHSPSHVLNGAFTIEWFQYYSSQTTPIQRVFYKGNLGFEIQNNTTRLILPHTTLSASYSNYLNEWRHIVISRDTSGVISLMVDGNKLIETTYTGRFNTDSIVFGKILNNNNTSFNGFITNFRYIPDVFIYTSYSKPLFALPPTDATEILLLSHNSANVYRNYVSKPIILNPFLTAHSTNTPFSNNGLTLYPSTLPVDLSPIQNVYNPENPITELSTSITNGVYVFDKDASNVLFNDPSGNHLDYSTEITFAGWVRPTGSQNTISTIIVNRTAPTSGTHTIGLEYRDDYHLRFRRRGILFDTATNLFLVPNEWNFVAFSVSNEQIDVYVSNSNQTESHTLTDPAPASLTITNIMIGGDIIAESTNRFMNGQLSQLLLFNKYLDSQTINNIAYYTGITLNYYPLQTISSYPSIFVPFPITTKKSRLPDSNNTATVSMNNETRRLAPDNSFLKYGASHSDRIRKLKLANHINSKLL